MVVTVPSIEDCFHTAIITLSSQRHGAGGMMVKYVIIVLRYYHIIHGTLLHVHKEGENRGHHHPNGPAGNQWCVRRPARTFFRLQKRPKYGAAAAAGVLHLVPSVLFL